MRTLYSLLSKSVGERGTQDAIIIPNNANVNSEGKHDYCNVTYNQLMNDALFTATLLLKSGLTKGDVVSLVLANGYPIITTFLGVTFSQCIVAPLNSTYKVDEFKFYLEDMNAKLVIVAPEFKDAVTAANQLGIKVWELTETSDFVNTHHTGFTLNGVASPSTKNSIDQVLEKKPEESDIALFLHTSGTTSRPKLVPLSHKNINVSSGNISNVFHVSIDSRSLVVMPLFHVHGLIGVTLSTLSAGGSLVVPIRFSATTFWSNVKQFHITWYSAVPTIHAILFSLEKEGQDSPNKGLLKFIRSCSSSLSPTLLQSLEGCYGCPVVESYGMTEAAHQMSSNLLPSDGKRKAGSVGPGANVLVGIASDNGDLLTEVGAVGEVCIKGENVFSGYHNNPKATEESFTKEGWFLTGDIGYLDEDGFLILKGRKKEIINRGGEKISPLEIDNSLLENDNIAEAVCFGVPDTKYGEEIWAAVIPKPSCPDLTEQQVKEFLSKKIVQFKIPKKIFITQSFPKTSTGKIQRRFISEHFLKQSQIESSN